MGIGKISLTTSLEPDIPKLRELGVMKPDNLRRKFYKNFCKLDCAVVMWQPHQFGAVTNFGIPYTKVDIHSKHFDRFHELKDYLLDLFPDSHEIDLNDFNISRIELHSDIESLPLDIVLARLWVIGYRRESVSFYKGKTIYIGTDPKIRIFNKNSQLLRKLGKTGKLTENELQLMNGKPITRFSIEIGQLKMNLNQLVNDPKQLASYFDRFKFYNFEDDESINRVGGFQILMSKIRREHRKSFDQFKDRELERLIQRNFKSSIRAWFKKEAIEKPISIKAKLIQEAKRFNRILSTGMIE